VIGVLDEFGRCVTGYEVEERGGSISVVKRTPLPLQNYTGQIAAAHGGYLLASDISGVALLRMR
jgi:hypothetical protein